MIEHRIEGAQRESIPVTDPSLATGYCSASNRNSGDCTTCPAYGASMREPDAVFADPRLAVLYDFFDDDRSDLTAYLALVDELGARRIVDLGCGTGSLAVLLAARGLDVIGVDPARASLDVAGGKPYADRVRWVHGDATVLDVGDKPVDLVVMTGNAAQVFVDGEDWHTTLACARRWLRRDGWLVFETRRPEARAWESWDVQPTEVSFPDGRQATVSRTVTSVDLPPVSFKSVTRVDGEDLVSRSTLRFRAPAEITADLARHGFEVGEIRDAPDRPGLELVFLARATGSPFDTR